MDRLDVEILRRLSQDARKSYLEIARELNVANATVHERISKLREKGILKGFYTQMSAEKLGSSNNSFRRPDHVSKQAASSTRGETQADPRN